MYACRVDVLTPKPGNVSVDSPGHGMCADDFLRSAAAAAPALMQLRSCVGESIYAATRASFDVAQCNTNLGIILLAAPLLRAALLRRQDEPLLARLEAVLNDLSVHDSSHVFAAIRYASPGGLGSSNVEDVANEPTLALKEVMKLAAVRDRIAFQYAHGFKDIFDWGMPLLGDYRDRGDSMVWAALGLYLAFLSRHLDTHIVRKHGAQKAQEVRLVARTLESDFKACENPATLQGALAEFDQKLKRGGVNPGTSADLTVASVLALLLLHV